MPKTTSHPLLFYTLENDAPHIDDCDCNACPSMATLPRRLEWTPALYLQTVPEQQTIPLHSEIAVAFVPSRSQVALINSATGFLLDQFRQPMLASSMDDSTRLLAQELYELGFLQVADAAPTPPLPADELVAWLHITNACNLRCTYCYIEKDNQMMSEAIGETALATIFEAATRHGYRRVALKYAGGEASLNTPLMFHLQELAVQQAERLGISLRTAILSNGVALSKAFLERCRNEGIRLMISLDGLPEIHDAQRPRLGGQGSAKAVMGTIELAQRLGLNLTVSITVTGGSIKGLPEVVDWLLARKIHFSLNFYRECDRSESYHSLQHDEQLLIEGLRVAYRHIEQQLPSYSLLGCLLDRTNLSAAHQRTCAVGENYLVIDHKGRIAKCQMEIKRPVTSIWEEDPLSMIRLDEIGVQNRPVDEKEGCRDCEWKYWCAGGCAVATYRATGRYDIKSPNCAIYKALYPEVLRLEGLRLLALYNLGR